MSASVSVYENRVAVLYDEKYKPVGACAGDSLALREFIEDCKSEYRDLKIFGFRQLS
jgi:hypothetical protein